jgi:hypothetical protein
MQHYESTPIDEEEDVEAQQKHSHSPAHYYGIAPGYKKESVGAYTMARVIEMYCEEIEFCNSNFINENRQIRFFMHLTQYKRKKSVKSPIFDLSKQTSINKPIQFRNVFHIQYIHNLRKRVDSLDILLKVLSKKGSEFKSVSSVTINLMHVLQRPFEDTIYFRVKTQRSKAQYDDSSGDENEPAESTNVATNDPISTANTSNLATQNVITPSSSSNTAGVADSNLEKEDMKVLVKLKVKIYSKPLTTEYQHYLVQQQHLQQDANQKKKKINNLLKWGKKQPTEDSKSAPNKTKGDDSDVDSLDSAGEEPVSDEYSSGSEKGPSTPNANTLAETGTKDLKRNTLKRNLIKGWQFLKHKSGRDKNEDDYDENYEHEAEDPAIATGSSNTKRPFAMKLKKSKLGKANNTSVSSSTPDGKQPFDSAREDTELPPCEPIENQLATILNINDQSKSVIKRVMLVSGITNKGKMLASYLQTSQTILRSFTLCTMSYEEVNLALNKILQTNNRVKKNIDYDQEDDDKIKIIIMGADRYVNTVLRACLNQSSNAKQIWNNFLFYIIPIPQPQQKSINSIAHHIALESPQYNALFNSEEWNNALSTQSLAQLIRNSNQRQQERNNRQSIIEQNILRYLNESKDLMQMSIAQVVMDTNKGLKEQVEDTNNDSQVQTIIPCLSSVEIMSLDQISGKNFESKQKKLLKRVQNVLSPTSTPPDTNEHLTRERRSSSAVEYEAEILNQSQMQYDDERQEERDLENGEDSRTLEAKLEKLGEKGVDAMELKIDYYINKNKHTMKHHFHTVVVHKLPIQVGDTLIEPEVNTFTLCTVKKPQSLTLTSKTKSQSMKKYEFNVSKIVCKVESKKRPTVSVRIDGVQWHGVKFLSISPQWVGSLQFVIAHLGAGKAQKNLSSIRTLKDSRSTSSLHLKVSSDEELGL